MLSCRAFRSQEAVRREAHVSAEQGPPQPRARVSQAQCDASGAEGPQAAAREGPQAARGERAEEVAAREGPWRPMRFQKARGCVGVPISWKSGGRAVVSPTDPR